MVAKKTTCPSCGYSNDRHHRNCSKNNKFRKVSKSRMTNLPKWARRMMEERLKTGEGK